MSRAIAPRLYPAISTTFGVNELPNKRGDYVARLGIEVVPRAIKINRYEIHGVESVLLAVRLCHRQECPLRYSIRRVRLFGVSVPDVLFLERHGAVLRIRADRSDLDELTHPI